MGRWCGADLCGTQCRPARYVERAMPLLHTTPRLSGPHALVLPALLVAAGLNTAHAQVPAKCLEIESILVDACTAQCPGAAEGSNEMVRFITGPSPCR